MKISKSDLKQIVKECLIEILAEGLGSSTYPQQMGSRPPSMGNNVVPARKIAENTSYGSKPQSFEPSPGVALLAAARPDMASIFEDTARTTYQTQTSAEKGMDMAAMRGDMAAKVASAATPDQLFGEESMSKWADLAFMPSSKKI